MERAVSAMAPVAGGVVLVFNSIQQGMYGKFRKEIQRLDESFQAEGLAIRSEMFAAFGPFDNILRLETDDFSVLTPLSSLSYVSSQQIQYAYPIWRSHHSGADALFQPDNIKRPFCLITQFKIQNHLILFDGPEIEPAAANLMKDVIQKYLDEEKKVKSPDDIPVIELMATLGWDEFLVFIRSRSGYDPMISLILKRLRQNTLHDIEKFLEDAEYRYDNELKEKKHIFLTSHTTPGYEMKLMDRMENLINDAYNKKKTAFSGNNPNVANNADIILDFNELKEIHHIPEAIAKEYGYPENYPFSDIRVSTRLSVKPGHCRKVSNIVKTILTGAPLEKTHGTDTPIHPDIETEGIVSAGADPRDISVDSLISIGRYDMYPWLAKQISIMDFALLFSLLTFSLAGNLKQDEEHGVYLSRSQYYNSFTIISIPMKSEKNDDPRPTPHTGQEGSFVKELYDRMALSIKKINGKELSIQEQFRGNPLLNRLIPDQMANGVARIFALFDSCMTDRFTCDTFLDMYPFMQRLSDIICYTEEMKDKGVVFTPPGAQTGDELNNLFYNAISRFYKGFSHRYLASYPMMDKNETGVDFTGRLHRALSATTGFQNIMFADLDFHMEEGFNTISNYPGIRIHRDSFNTTESNVLNLFQVETFYVFYHEIIHAISNEHKMPGRVVRDAIDNIERAFPPFSDNQARESFLLLMEEAAGDLFMFKTVFNNDFKLYAFWYWLMIIKRKKQLDSQILYRFFLLAQEKNQLKIREILAGPPSPHVDSILDLFRQSTAETGLPQQLVDDVLNKIKEYVQDQLLNSTDRLKKFWLALDLLSRAMTYLEKKTNPAFDTCCKHYRDDAGDDLENPVNPEHPLRPPRFFSGQTSPNAPRRHAGDDAIPRLTNQKSSIRLLRRLLEFIHENRDNISLEPDGVINFPPREPTLRLQLFNMRIALLNTLQWESLRWKARMLREKGVSFHPELQPIPRAQPQPGS